jgi:hypothetical protein
MKTKCYCVFCSKHPLYEMRNEQKILTGFEPGCWIYDGDYPSGREVNCLYPESDFFGEFDADPEEFEYPETAYGDGVSQTGCIRTGYAVFANCGNEDYEGK